MPRHITRSFGPAQTKLLDWYSKNKRPLPWRAAGQSPPSPYAVWVSEMMLQQTRVETVIPYYEKWLQLFPTVQALAKASEHEVLNAWEGLGYYSRARNFHKAAKLVVEKYNGELPRDLEELRRLPGIGQYTVGALASIIFGMDEPALDGNLKRVYARLFDVSEPVDSHAGEKTLWKLARENLPKGKAADFNQALMDLGALICLPKNPRCSICPVMKDCQARRQGTQAARPVRKPKQAVPHYIQAAAVVVVQVDNLHKVLLAQRPSNGLLGGMWEFPNGRVAPGRDPARDLAKVIRSGYSLRLGAKRKVTLGVFRHAYTHFKVTVHAFACDADSISEFQNMKWVALQDLDDYPMGRIDRQIAQALLQIHT